MPSKKDDKSTKSRSSGSEKRPKEKRKEKGKGKETEKDAPSDFGSKRSKNKAFKTLKVDKTVHHAGGGIKKPHRWRNGTVALREIKKYQKSTDLIFQSAPFKRMIKEIAARVDSKPTHFQSGTKEMLQTVVENILVKFFRSAVDLCSDRKRVTVGKKDLEIVWNRDYQDILHVSN
jgi:histone H3